MNYVESNLFFPTFQMLQMPEKLMSVCWYEILLASSLGAQNTLPLITDFIIVDAR